MSTGGTTIANANDTPPPYEKMYTEMGYKSIEEAVKDFENHFKQELKMPLRIPPLAFTH